MARAREPVVRMLVVGLHTLAVSSHPFPLVLGVSRAFPGGSVVKNLRANAGDMASIPGLGAGNGSSLQYSCLGNQETLEARFLQTIQLCQFPQYAGWGRIKVGLMASVSQGWGNPALTSLSLSPVGEITDHLG